MRTESKVAPSGSGRGSNPTPFATVQSAPETEKDQGFAPEPSAKNAGAKASDRAPRRLKSFGRRSEICPAVISVCPTERVSSARGTKECPAGTAGSVRVPSATRRAKSRFTRTQVSTPMAGLIKLLSSVLRNFPLPDVQVDKVAPPIRGRGQRGDDCNSILRGAGRVVEPGLCGVGDRRGHTQGTATH